MGEKVARVRMCINERAGMEKYDSSNCDRQHKVYKDAACEHCPQYREVEQVQEAGTIVAADADGDVTDAASVTAEQFEKQVEKFAEIAAETPFIKK